MISKKTCKICDTTERLYDCTNCSSSFCSSCVGKDECQKETSQKSDNTKKVEKKEIVDDNPEVVISRKPATKEVKSENSLIENTMVFALSYGDHVGTLTLFPSGNFTQSYVNQKDWVGGGSDFRDNMVYSKGSIRGTWEIEEINGNDGKYQITLTSDSGLVATSAFTTFRKRIEGKNKWRYSEPLCFFHLSANGVWSPNAPQNGRYPTGMLFSRENED